LYGKGGENLRKQLTVRVPKTLHAELLEEAKREGVSLNQLCLFKLGRPANWYRQHVPETEEGKEVN
jgi:predicted HicB family RNase H-like nuclease